MKRILLLFITLTATLSSFAQFGVTDEQYDSIQAHRDSMQVVLNEANVSVKKRAVKADIDKLTYSVADDPEAQSQTAIELLRKVPMVTVDGDDNIKVNGSSSFKVYVNGKPNQMMSNNPKEVFKSFPAAAIQKIEVITDPGAKYDAEGVAGVINIITEQQTSTKGWMATPRFGVNNRGIDGGFFSTVQYGKFTLSANYGFGKMKMNETVNETETTFNTSDLFHCMKSDGYAKPDVFYNFGSLEASYEFSDHDLLSVNGGVHGHKLGYDATGKAVMYDIDNNPIYGFTQLISTKQTNIGYNAGADWQHTFSKPEQTLTFSYRLDSSPGNQRQTKQNYDIFGEEYQGEMVDYKIDPHNKSYEHTAQVDFTTPIGKFHTLSLGGKFINRINESDSRQYNKPSQSDFVPVIDVPDSEWTYNDLSSLHYQHKNNIGAGYAEYILKVQKFSARAGLRYEHSHINVTYPDGKREGFTKNFNDWVPSINLGYNLSQLQMLKLTYNYRIARPGIDMLSPYVDISSPQTKNYGNPDLESEQAHNLSLAYSLFGMKFSINAQANYTFSNNGLTNYTFLDKNLLINTTYDNFLRRREASMNLFLNWNISQHTALTVNGNGGYTKLKVNETGDQNDGFSGMAFCNFRQDLWWKLKLNLSGGGGTSWVNLQGTGDNWYFYNITLSRSFLKEDRLTVTAKAGNFLPRHRNWEQTTMTPDYKMHVLTRIDQMEFGVSVSWRLGKLQTAVKKVAHGINNDDKASSGQQQGAMGGGQQQGGGMGM